MKAIVLKEFINILDTMTGADGGVKFVYLKAYLDNLEHEHTYASEQIEEIVLKFSKLIEVVQPK